MNLSIENSIGEEIWCEFLERHPQGNIFHTPEMYRVFEQAKGYKPRCWAAIDEFGKILAIFTPVQITLVNGVLHRLTTRNIAYGGCLCAPGLAGEEALATLLDRYNQEEGQKGLFTELRNLSNTNVIQPVLERCGFIYEDHLDYLIDLDCSSEQVLQNIGARTRKHIRQALKRGSVVVEEIIDRSQIAVWYELVRKTYLAARVPLAGRTLFEAAFDILQSKGMIKFWLARIGEVFVAASVELLYKDIIYGWYGGVDRAYAKEMPGEVLMWRILEWGATHGYKVYDFGGAGKPGEEYGVRDFKAKFGGQLVCFGRNKKIHSPGLLRWSERGYQIYRQLAGRFSIVSQF
jgi:serine/alanine adding enzyme